MTHRTPQAIKIPPALSPGDCIGLMCPAGQMKLEDTQTCRETLQAWNYQVKVGATVGERKNYFSGTESERLIELQELLDDPQIHAILFARGGYGTSALLDKLNWDKFLVTPKWLIGYSDITILHLHLASQFNICSLHAPMAAAFNDGQHISPFIFSLKNVLQKRKYDYGVQSLAMNRPGNATGRLLGGNLSLVVHSLGTSSEPDWNGCILFLEDIAEYLYHIDRMFVQLQRAGVLEKISGLIIGGFTDMKDTILPFGKKAEAIIQERVKQYEYPVAFGFPVGHQNENLALMHGAFHKLEVSIGGETNLSLIQTI